MLICWMVGTWNDDSWGDDVGGDDPMVFPTKRQQSRHLKILVRKSSKVQSSLEP